MLVDRIILPQESNLFVCVSPVRRLPDHAERSRFFSSQIYRQELILENGRGYWRHVVQYSTILNVYGCDDEPKMWLWVNVLLKIAVGGAFVSSFQTVMALHPAKEEALLVWVRLLFLLPQLLLFLIITQYWSARWCVMYGEMFIADQQPAAGQTGAANRRPAGWKSVAQTRL